MPSLNNCATVDGNSIIMKWSPRICVAQSVFEIGWERENQREMRIFSVTRTERGDQMLVWVGKVLLQCLQSSSTVHNVGVYYFVQYMEVSKAVSGLYEAPSSVFLPWATEDVVYKTLDIGRVLRKSEVETEELIELVPFRSIVRTVQVLRSNIAINMFSAEPPWPLHRFYINGLYMSRVENLDTTSM